MGNMKCPSANLGKAGYIKKESDEEKRCYCSDEKIFEVVSGRDIARKTVDGKVRKLHQSIV